MTNPHAADTDSGNRPNKRRLQALILPLLLFLATSVVYAVSAEREGVNTDAYAASVGAWRIATTGGPWLDGVDVKQLGGTHGDQVRGRFLSLAENGHVVPHRMAGPIIAGVPFYWVLGNDPDPRIFSLWPGGLAAAALSAAAVLLIFLSIRRRVSLELALASTLVFAFATPTWSVSANGLWTHPVTQVGLAGAAYASSRSRWWMAGVFLGLGMLGRPHLAVVAAILGLGVAWSRRDMRAAVGVGVPAMGALGLLAVWNRTVYGGWSIGGAYGGAVYTRAAAGYGGFGMDQLTNYLGFLLAPDRGFLIWSPIILVLLPTLVRTWGSLPDWCRWLLVGGVVYTFFQLRLNYFAGGEGFHAYRHGLELMTCMTPALVFAASAAGRVTRMLLPPVIALQVAAFTIGATVEGFFVPLDRVWRDNGFLLALRQEPAIIGGFTGAVVLLGIAISFGMSRRHGQATPPID